jgi:hypothetical protein
MRFTCWKAHTTQPTSANLHRVTDYFGNFTLLIDEFHPSRGKTNSQVQELVDILNMSFQRSANMVRMDRDAAGNLTPNMYRVFGPKIFTSYECDEDEAFARRAIVVPTGTVPVPKEMVRPQLPPEAKEEARALRGRLLAWRGRKLAAGLPELDGSSWKCLLEAAGAETGQVFWPLLEMVPRAHEEAAKNLVAVASMRRDATFQVRYASDDAYILDFFAGLWEAGSFHRVGDGWFISTREIISELPSSRTLNAGSVGRTLKQLGLQHCTRRFELGGQSYQRKGFLVNEETAQVMARHDVPWPRANGAESEFKEAL